MSNNDNDTVVYYKGVIWELVALAKRTALIEGRTETRFPFFRPAWMELDGHSFSGFTRDISLNGLGLLHCVEISPCEVIVKFAECPEGIRLSLDRCEPIGDGWFISGGSIVGKGKSAAKPTS